MIAGSRALKSDAPLRVLHCPHNVAGNPSALARAERALGLRSISVSAVPSSLGYQIDEVLTEREAPAGAKLAARLRLVRRALREFDVVHFNYGETMMPARRPAEIRTSGLVDAARSGVERALWMKDLPILRAAGKVIAVTYQGDDARQGGVIAGLEINAANHVPPGYYTEQTDRTKRKAIAQFERYADLIYALNPDLLRVLPARARFQPYASVDPRTLAPQPSHNERPVILHAPTDRGVKGTPMILAAVERLRAEGEDFEFTLVEGLPYADALRLYGRADLLVDQLLLGWYGALAVELMALGKPVACYLRHEDLQCLPEQMRADLPMIEAGPDTVYEAIRGFLARSPAARADLGARSRRFVEKWHDPARIAASLAGDYRSVLDQRGSRAARIRR